MIIRSISIAVLFLFFSTCGSTIAREDVILNYPEKEISKYENYLIKIDYYTTNGKIYHKKYYRHLIGIARIVREEKNLEIINNSIGFYYDKRGEKKNNLFIGIDIKIYPGESISNSSYLNRASTILQNNLCDILYTIHSCKTMFVEKEIIGMVIGMNWTIKDKSEMLNIWIDKKDVFLFEKKKLTINELIERNSITNTRGKIIRLPI